MPKRQIFYSFHYANDVMRVAQIRSIGSLEDNKPVSANNWEEVKKKGDAGVKKWINDNMNNRTCLVVMVGSNTANRKWVKYEIEKAWNDGKGVVGIYIHNIKCPNNGKSLKGNNPFDSFTIGKEKKDLSKIVKCYNPNSFDAYNDIRKNIEKWVEEAITIRKNI
jgi:Thoeris protein ThsB, TIR-like domain